MATFTIAGNVYRDGNPVKSFDLMDGASHVLTRRDADALLTTYIAGLVIQGGTCSYERTCDEFRVAMPDGTVEYLKPPRVVDHAPKPPAVLDVVVQALRVNADREHFSDYEGIDKCPAVDGGNCNCGKTDAEQALRALGLTV